MIYHPKLKTLLLTVLGAGLVFAGAVQAASEAYDGYVFCASGYRAYLVDPDGNTVHTWQATNSARSCAYLLPDGCALFPIQTSCPVRGDGAYPHGRLQKISWEGEIIWDAVVCDNTYTPGYDLEPMPNGNILAAGASSSGGFKIVEIQPSGTSGSNIVWEYELSKSGIRMERINSISFNPDLGESGYVGIDINEKNELVVIDKAQNRVVYTYSVTTASLLHAARWVTKYHIGTDIVMPDADTAAMRVNNFLVVNNSKQVVEVNPVAGTFVKTIPFSFSDHEGSVQRLPNGNTLVTTGRGSTATEIDDNGNTVRTITLPGTVQRAYMYGPDYPGLMDFTRIKTAVPKPAATGKLYYNTATGIGRVAFENANGSPLFMRIFTLNGTMVFSSGFRGSEASFSTETLESGVYYVEVRCAGRSLKKSFIRMR